MSAGRRSVGTRDLAAPTLPLIEEFHRDWLAGALTDQDLRDHWPWLWISHGGFSLKSRDIGLEVLEAVGYVTDSPDVVLPEAFWAYQGRAAGQALGVSWTPDQQMAIGYSKTHAAIVERATGADPGRALYRARVRPSDVLMFTRLTVEVLVRPERVEAEPRRPSLVGGSPGWARASAKADAIEALRRVLMPAIRLAGEPENEEATFESLSAMYLAHEIDQLSDAVNDIYRGRPSRAEALAAPA